MNKQIGIAIMTVSDTRTKLTDTSGGYLVGAVEAAGHRLVDRAIVPDTIEAIRSAAKAWIERDEVDVIIATGGTGLTGRDVTPEAMQPLFDKHIDGFAAVFHRVSYDKIGLSTMQSRACAGVSGGTFIFCLPGSGGAVRDGWSVIGPQLDSATKPCNLTEIMPRLMER